MSKAMTLFWMVMAIAVFVRWYEHNHKPIDTITIHCPSPNDPDWALTSSLESDRCYSARMQEQEYQEYEKNKRWTSTESRSIKTFHGYPCTSDCSGHEAGYSWAEDRGITDSDDCGGKSASFEVGCRVYVEENN
jgi:hypothetical protein